MRKDHLRHAFRAVCWHVGNDDATRMSSLNINDVIARRQHTNIFQLWQLCDNILADNDLISQHNICTGSPRHRLTGLCTVIDRHLAAFLKLFPRQITRIS